jgi:hypothetical protein
MLKKKCTTCGKTLPVENFYKQQEKILEARAEKIKNPKINKDGTPRKYKKFTEADNYINVCMSCHLANCKKQHKKNKDKNNARKKRNYRARHEYYLNQVRNFRKNFPEKVKAQRQKHWHEVQKPRMHNDPFEKFKVYTKTRASRIMNSLASGKVCENDLLDCDSNTFIKHIESQFTEEMNWDNYAEEWEYDHIKPLAAFDFSNEDEVKEAFNYKNVRPLNKKQNQLKGSTWNGKKQYYNEN